MGRLILSSLFLLVTLSCFSQDKVLLEAGTVVPVIADSTFKASGLTEGQTIELKVSRDVKVSKGIVAIPAGSIARAWVIKAKRSKLAGTKGRLTIDIREVILPDGQTIGLTDGVYFFMGKNRTSWAGVGAAFFSPAIFLAGSKAKLPKNYEMHPKVEVSHYIEVQ